MKPLGKIRNIGIIAHIDAGKTTTTERILFLSGRTHRLGDVDSGNTVMDYLEEERERGITIVSAAASLDWNDHLIHLIDTPGHIDFTAEVQRSLRVIDGAVVIFSGVEGVEAQSEKVWRQADYYELPRLVFINKLDRIGSSFNRVIREINSKFSEKAVALQIPVGVEREFSAIIDLISMQFFTFGQDLDGKIDRCEIPSELRIEAERHRNSLIERLADFSDGIAEHFIEDAPISQETLECEIRHLVLDNVICPVVIGSAKKNIGISTLLDAIIKYLPSPDSRKIINTETKGAQRPEAGKADPKSPMSGLVFKIVASPSADLYYLRTYTGVLNVGASLLVPRTGEKTKVKRIVRLYANNVEPVEQVGPGDIVGVVGPKELITGDTLCDPARPISLESVQFPEPILSMSIEPYSSKDKDRLHQTMTLLCREDPTLKATHDENTGQFILSGMGELHLTINLKRINNEFNIKARCGEPRVEFRETIAQTVNSHAVFDKVVGDRELYAEATIALSPEPHDLERPFSILSKVENPNSSKNFTQVALDYLKDGLRTGGNYGYPLIYVSAVLNRLETHPEKTTEGAILGAILKALDQAIKDAGTKILEPIMKVEIYTTESTLGDVSNFLITRRADIHKVTDVADMKKINCDVPLAEMFGFGKTLPSLTGGRGSFIMEPSGFSEAPRRD